MADWLFRDVDQFGRSWLLGEIGSDRDVGLSGLNNALVVTDTEVRLRPMENVACDDMTVRFLFVKEFEVGNRIYGKCYGHMPNFLAKDLGEISEQRFEIIVVNDQPHVYVSAMYNSGYVLLSKIFNECWSPKTIIHTLCRVENTNEDLLSGVLLIMNLLTSRSSKSGALDDLWTYCNERLEAAQRKSSTADQDLTACSHEPSRDKKHPLKSRLKCDTNVRDSLKADFITRYLDKVNWFIKEGPSSSPSPSVRLESGSREEEESTANDGEKKSADPIVREQQEDRLDVTPYSPPSAEQAGEGASKSSEDTTCASCGATFIRRYERDRHIRSVHRQERTHQCRSCSKMFFQRSHLKEHMATVHENRRDHECSICKRSFGTRYKVRRHLKGVHNIVSQ